MENKLEKNIIFVNGYIPYDYTEFLGQLAVSVYYTDGDMQMLTTKSTKPNVYASSDFESEDEFYEFINFLKSNNIPRLYK